MVHDAGRLPRAGRRRKAIGLSQPKSLGELEKVGNNLFRPTGKIDPVPLAERNRAARIPRLSGSNPISQMMAMIETTRGFEANSRMIQAQDSAIGTLVEPRAAKLIVQQVF